MTASTVTPELRALLRRVKLGRCLDTLPERLALATTGGLGHAEFLELVLADEVTRRETTSADRRARAAGLDPAMTLDRWDDTAKVTYDRAVWNELCALRFVDGGHNAVIMGPVGVGKTFGKVRVLGAIDEIDWDGAFLLIECVSEDLAIKQAVFAELEEAAPGGLPLTSNSSGFPISRIAEGRDTAGRLVGLHFFMPANLVPCVEVIVGERSDPAVADTVQAAVARLGKRPVRVNKDIPGFLGNRLQAAIMREALALVEAQGGF